MESINFDIGDRVKFVSRGDYALLSPGDIVTVVDIKPGMFDPDVYVTVETKYGKRVTGFSWRFKKQEVTNGQPTEAEKRKNGT